MDNRAELRIKLMLNLWSEERDIFLGKMSEIDRYQEDPWIQNPRLTG